MPPTFCRFFATSSRFVCSKLEEKLIFDIRYEPSTSMMLLTIFFDQEKQWDVAPNFCATWIQNLCLGIHSGLLLTNPGRLIFLFHPFFSSLVWRFFFPFFFFSLISFSKQLPIFFQLDLDELFQSRPSSPFSIFSRGLGDKCTPGASAKSQNVDMLGRLCAKESGGPFLGSKKRYPPGN